MLAGSYGSRIRARFSLRYISSAGQIEVFFELFNEAFMSAARDTEADRIAAVRWALAHGPRPIDGLLAQLGISQPTFSRTIHGAKSEVISFREPGVRTPRYALVRNEPVPSPQAIFRVDEQGKVAEVGAVSFLRGGGTWVDLRGSDSRLNEGLPPAMAFAAPSGYLGARIAKNVASSIGVPASLRDWSDDHRMKYLCMLGADVAGSLIWGQASFAQYMTARRAQPIATSDIESAYRDLADVTTQTGAGSSAGGKQPKFTCETEEGGHLIVKFARIGTRSADLLIMEELALRALNDSGVPAAATRYLQSDRAGYGYLEVARFDRVGRFGRRGLISAGALDDELFGRRDNWPAFAERCQQEGLMDARAMHLVHVLTAFSELIGNGDRHFENLSLMTDERGRPVEVSQAYDMLPMMYAPVGGGIEPPLRDVAPSFDTLGARPDVWRIAFAAAKSFWDAAANDGRMSGPMREASARNVSVISEAVAPLLGAADSDGAAGNEPPAGPPRA